MFRKSSCPGCSFAQGQSVPSNREKTGFETEKIHAGHEKSKSHARHEFFLVSTQSSLGRARFHAIMKSGSIQVETAFPSPPSYLNRKKSDDN